MENVYITIQVTVSDEKFHYDGKRGQSEVVLQLPRQFAESIEPGNIFIGTLSAALANYDNADKEEE